MLLAILGRGLDVTATDLRIADALRSLAPGDTAASVMRVLTHLGATDVALPLGLVVVLLLVRSGDRRSAVALVLAYTATQAIVALVKVIVERARPEDALAHADGYAFPSGHSATAVAVYGALALIAARDRPPRICAAAVAAAAALALTVGLTRAYLGVHYPTDVLAGWLLGGLVLATAWRLTAPHPKP